MGCGRNFVWELELVNLIAVPSDVTLGLRPGGQDKGVSAFCRGRLLLYTYNVHIHTLTPPPLPQFPSPPQHTHTHTPYLHKPQTSILIGTNLVPRPSPPSSSQTNHHKLDSGKSKLGMWLNWDLTPVCWWH